MNTHFGFLFFPSHVSMCCQRLSPFSTADDLTCRGRKVTLILRLTWKPTACQSEQYRRSGKFKWSAASDYVFHYTCASPDMACQNVCYGGLLPKLSVGPVPYGGSGENSLGKSMETYFFKVLHICMC